MHKIVQGSITEMTETHLIFVRHGEAKCNVDGVIGGLTTCQGLTALGHQQTEQLAARLQRENHTNSVSSIYYSPLPRTVQTYDIIKKFLKVDHVDSLHDLREQDHGNGDGKTWKSVVENFGRIPSLEPFLPLAEGGESWQQYIDRMQKVLSYITSKHKGETVLIIGHGETIYAAACYFFRLPINVKEYIGFNIYNASITRWKEEPISIIKPNAGNRWALAQYNDISHIRDNQQHNLNT